MIMSRSTLTPEQRELATGFHAWMVARFLRDRIANGFTHSFSHWDLKGCPPGAKIVCREGERLGLWDKSRWADVWDYNLMTLPWLEECAATEQAFHESPEAEDIRCKILGIKPTNKAPEGEKE